MTSLQNIKANKKIYIAIVISLAVVGIFFYFSKYTSSLLESNERFLKFVTQIQKESESLNSKVLQSTFYLYSNYDEIHQKTEHIQTLFNDVKEYEFIGYDNNYHMVFDEIQTCQNILTAKEKTIGELLQYNSSIKNIILNFPRVVYDFRNKINFTNTTERQALMELSDVRSALLLARGSADGDYLAEMLELQQRLEKIHVTHKEQEKILNNAKNLLKIFVTIYPKYVASVQEVSKSDLQEHLEVMKKNFMDISSKQIAILHALSFFLAVIFIGLVVAILLLLLRLEKENRELKNFQDRLKYSLKHDLLTGLLNRFSFEDKQKEMNNPVLVLVNIDRFKQINDFYGIEAGDLILRQVGNDIVMITKKYYDKNYYVFRLGADDFGILIDKQANLFSINRFANMIVEHFENAHFNIKNLFEVTISVSIASSDISPLLESCDMALKQSKKHATGKYVQYDEFLHNETIYIANNLSILSMIKGAIKDDRIVPFFQPIYDVKVDCIHKYEALVRIVDTDGGIIPPGVFLDVAKQSKLYRQITKIMIHKTFEILKTTDCEVSINLTYEDIYDQEITIMIENEFFIDGTIAQRVIFEITESENVEDYDILYNFIHKFKVYGCRFAIDDFGSGYSNFDKILKLEVDFIKIDGSLIKDIDTNENSKLITQMMVGFAKIKHIKTIAEFVSTPQIQETVIGMGVDYLQGYHIGKPAKSFN